MYKNKLIYILIFMFIILIGCKEKQDSKKEHVLYNNDISYYFIVRGQPHFILDYSGNKILINSYNIDIRVRSLIEKEIENVNYEVYSTNLLNETELVFQNINKIGIRTPINKNLASNITVGGNGYSNLYGRIVYNLNEEQEIKFYEEIINIFDKEINENSYSENQENDFFSLNISLNDQSDYYNSIFSFNFTNKEIIHFDFQSWFVSKDGVYPFVGLYGFNINENTLVIPNNLIYKDTNFKYIYINSKAYDKNNMVKNIYYRLSLDSLINKK